MVRTWGRAVALPQVPNTSATNLPKAKSNPDTSAISDVTNTMTTSV